MKLRHKIVILGLVLLAVSLIATLEKAYAIKTYHVSGSFEKIGDTYVGYLGHWYDVTHSTYEITYGTEPPYKLVILIVLDMKNDKSDGEIYYPDRYGHIYASHTPAFYASEEVAWLESDYPGWHDSWITIETPYDC